VADLSDEQLMGPQLRIVNPLLWEIEHFTWLQEKWALRQAPTVPVKIHPESRASRKLPFVRRI
jgi:hypothetical protein